MITKRELILAVGTAVAVVVIVVFVMVGLQKADAATRHFSPSEAREYVAMLNYELVNYRSVRPRFYNLQQFITDLSYNVKNRTATTKDASTSVKKYTPTEYAERREILINLYLGTI